MRALDLSPNLLLVLGALAGLGGGALAVRLCDVLPARYDITQVASGAARTRRNVGVVVAATAVGLWLAHLVAGAPSMSLERAAFFGATNLALALALVAAAAVDLEHMILPNELTLGAAALALATSYWRAVGLGGALVGAAVGLALTYLPFLLYKKIRGRSGMGLGDAKLAVAAGAWLGAPGAIFVVFASAVQAAACAVIMRLLRVELAVPASVQAELAELRAKAEAGDPEARALLADDPMAADVGSPALATMRLPMGPFLVLACLEFLFARGPIMGVFDDLTAEATPKKLWVAAIDLNAPAGTDPSHPAFYLPAQELLAGNSRGYWVVDPCKSDGNSCETGDECCGGFCRPGSGGKLVCTATVPSCAQEFENCSTSSDCCNSPAIQCINGRCALPLPK